VEAEDEQEAEPSFEAWDVRQGGLLVVTAAEGGPGGEGVVLGSASLGDDRGVCGLQRSAEISREAISGRSVCGCQDSGCGWV
jgi:hypothetical protein